MSTPIVPMSKEINPILASYLSQLVAHPLRTKSVTTGVLCLLQEVLGSNIAGIPPKRAPKTAPFLFRLLAQYHLNAKALKMGAYGALVSAPLSHILVGALQKAFAGKTGLSAKLGMILANSILVAPVQTVAFLASTAVINGASSLQEIKNTVRAGLLPVLRITWIVSPLSLTIAQKYIPVHLWVPFFNSVQFILGTVFNARVKKMRLAAQKKKELDDQGPKAE